MAATRWSPALRDALDFARILSWKNPWDEDVKHNGQHQRCGSHNQRDGLVSKDELERAPVKRNHVFEDALGSLVKAALLLFGRSMTENARAHHRRQREGDDRGQNNGDGQGNREFAKQAPNDVAHESSG